MKLIHYAAFALGLGWFVADSRLVGSGSTLRDTGLGVIATLLDRLPPSFGATIDNMFWFVLLLGWIVPVTFALKKLFRRQETH